MDIAFRRKKEVVSTSEPTVVAEKPKEQQQEQGVKLDDLELADSDREDYHNNVDILFVLDTTGSMGSYIEQSKTTIKKIVERFSKMEFNIKFSLCTYRDHPPQESSYVTKFNDLCSGKKLLEVLAQTSPQGGGDGPEAVMDGLQVGLSQTSWRLSEDNVTISKRFVFHICDAPPHGEEFGQSSSDSTWTKNGCPCGIKKEDINKLLKEHKVDYHLIKATNELNKMEIIFKECFGENYSETILMEANFSSHSDDPFTYGVSPSVAYACESACMPTSLPLADIPELDMLNLACEGDMAYNCLAENEDLLMAPSICPSKSEEKCEMKSMAMAPMMAPSKSMASEFSAPSSENVYSNMWDGVLTTLNKKLL